MLDNIDLSFFNNDNDNFLSCIYDSNYYMDDIFNLLDKDVIDIDQVVNSKDDIQDTLLNVKSRTDESTCGNIVDIDLLELNNTEIDINSFNSSLKTDFLDKDNDSTSDFESSDLEFPETTYSPHQPLLDTCPSEIDLSDIKNEDYEELFENSTFDINALDLVKNELEIKLEPTSPKKDSIKLKYDDENNENVNPFSIIKKSDIVHNTNEKYGIRKVKLKQYWQNVRIKPKKKILYPVHRTNKLFSNFDVKDVSDAPFVMQGNENTSLKWKSKNFHSELKKLLNNVTENHKNKAESINSERRIKTEVKKRPKIENGSFHRTDKQQKLRVRPNKCYHFWDFLRDLLNKEIHETSNCVEWIDESNGEFRILNTKLLSDLWGECKNSKNGMSYEKLSRTIRYYCSLNILKKTAGKRLHFKFSDGKMWRKTHKQKPKTIEIHQNKVNNNELLNLFIETLN